ncbi:MAG: helix-turn-helix domain-containing protein [Acidimicrobiia bacterium]
MARRQVSDLGTFIRHERQRSAISLRKLAERAGISNPYLSQIERGLRKPSADILKSIAHALSIRTEVLYERAGLLEERADEPDVEAAVAGDAVLTARQKQALIEVHRLFRSTAPRANPSERTDPR